MSKGMLKCVGKSVGVMVAVVSAVLALSSSGPASADMISIEIVASSGAESSSFQWVVPKVLDAQGHMEWQLPGPMTFVGSQGVLGQVQALSVAFDTDPGVSLGFQVAAGLSDTTFLINSSVISFAPLLNPQGFATAGTTLTDVNGNGATLTGLLAGAKVYKAMYDNTPVVDWALLVSSSTAPADMTVVTSDRMPGSGRTTIFASVYSIQSEFNFVVTAGDQASGTSRFDIQPAPIPEPATLSLVGTGILTAIGVYRRRRMN